MVLDHQGQLLISRKGIIDHTFDRWSSLYNPCTLFSLSRLKKVDKFDNTVHLYSSLIHAVVAVHGPHEFRTAYSHSVKTENMQIGFNE